MHPNDREGLYIFISLVFGILIIAFYIRAWIAMGYIRRIYQIMTSKFISLDAIVQDIIENMSETEKANLIEISEEDFVKIHFDWGTEIRNTYDLWDNKALLKKLEAKNADEASMIIIKAVWKELNE